MPALQAEQFTDFFQALHGYAPFPWQKKLALRIAKGEPWPPCIAVPTGAGKTACMDIALFALASQAEQQLAQCAAPRRIFFVVDRRIIVDEAYERAQRIAAKLEQAEVGILHTVAQRLRTLASGPLPLACVQLRGGIYRDDQWIRNPLQPCVIASTVDQIGSRLLYRGYGLRSDYTVPIHAAMAANDALIILDEAHCANPFRQTLQAIGKYRRWAESEKLAAPFVHTMLSATPPDEVSEDEIFRIDDDDKSHEVLGPRIMASKPVELKEAKKAKDKAALPELAKAMNGEIEIFLESGVQAIGVIVNRVKTACLIYQDLQARGDIDSVLLTGRMRTVDKDAIVGEWIHKLAVRSGDAERSLERPVVVVATQTLEVGANLDFDVLVTECAGLDALRQRFGRLNRGGCQIDARGVIMVRQDQIKTESPDPVYGEALANTWQWLTKDGREQIDFGIKQFQQLLPAEEDACRELLQPLSTPAQNAPVLLPSHLDLLVQTSPKPAPDPDVAVFLHGPKRGPADVLVCWRADLIIKDESSCIEALGLCMPLAMECMPVPLAVMRSWLQGSDVTDQLSDVDGQRLADDVQSKSNQERRFIRWFGPEDEQSRIYQEPADLRPGDVVVLPATQKGWDDLGHIPQGAWEDCAEQAVFKMKRRPVLRIHPALLVRWPTGEMRDFFMQFVEQTDIPADDAYQVLRQPLDTLSKTAEPDWLKEIASALASDKKLRCLPHPCGGWILQGSKNLPSDEEHSSFSDEDDLSSATVPVELTEHLEGVGRWARCFTEGLDVKLREDIILAARLHDLGKIDPRFQALLHQGNPWLAKASGKLLAKSGRISASPRQRRAARKSSRYPKGGRHELLSVRLAESAPVLLRQAHDSDLVLHLIASHHGRCRPFAPVIHDQAPQKVTMTFDSHELSADTNTGLERIDSGISERFWLLVRRYGWWGLAWLETLMRLADWRSSEEEQKHQQIERQVA